MACPSCLVGLSGLPPVFPPTGPAANGRASRRRTALHWHDRDYDPVSRVPPFRGLSALSALGASDTPGALAVLLPFGLGIVLGYLALSKLLPRVGS